MKSIVCLSMLFLLFNSSCKKSEQKQQQTELKAEERMNVSYGPNSRNVMDLYLPAKRSSNTPVILLLHGGSWVEGDKSMFTGLAQYFRDKGYAAATMNYRLTHTAENNIHPAQVNDVAAAINFLSSKAGEYQISANTVGLLGASAGAHIALLYTYAYNTDNKVKTVIGIASPSSFTDTRNINPLTAVYVQYLIGASPADNPQAYVQASPQTHVKAGSKPTLLFHGRQDFVVPVQQSIDLKAKLDAAGVANKLIIFEDTGHETLNAANTPGALLEAENWFKLYLK